MATGPALVFGQLTFPLNKETNSVGRKDRITNLVPEVDLGTLDQERSVSRKHAEVAYDHGTMALRDVGSTNGTTVNGEPLAHQVDRPLQDGDEVSFGGVTMAFAARAEWPEGVEAEWPPAPEASSPEETMVVGPMASEETMVAPPTMAEETMVAPPPDLSARETAVFAPGETPSTEAPPVVMEPEPAMPEPMMAAPIEAPVYVACSNHPHL
ncbi:MAG TPA: FHA domain-containing protein, partial [Candidatus Dormibacteraeota bacterium]